MEILELIENIGKYPNIDSDEKLDNLLKQLSECEIEDFFYYEFSVNEKYTCISNYFYSIDNIISIHNLNSESEEYLISILKSIIPYFKEGIKNSDIVKFLIFYHCSIYIKIDIKLLVNKYNLNIEFDRLLEKIAKIFKTIKIKPLNSLNDNNNYFLKETKIDFNMNNMAHINSQFRLINLEKHNYLINAKTISFSNLIYHFILFFKNENFKLFKETIIELDCLLMIQLFVKVCSLEEISKIYDSQLITNECLHFCLLKKILDKDYQKTLKYVELAGNILLQIFYSNKNFFKNLIPIFQFRELLYECMGLIINKLESNEIEFLIETLPINPFSQKNHVKKMLISLDNTKDSYLETLQLVFNKRNKYLTEQLTNRENSITLDQSLTNCCDFTLTYYLDVYDDELLLKLIKNILTTIKFINSEWFYDFRNYSNQLTVYYSNLFILSFAYKYKKLNDNAIQSLFKETILNNFFRNEFDELLNGTISQMSENFNFKSC